MSLVEIMTLCVIVRHEDRSSLKPAPGELISDHLPHVIMSSSSVELKLVITST
uniref:Uncharacterized protein n=1 Tax=Magallana gigas TaxID=29159 RepID=K1RIV5_MAGGI